MEWMVWESVRSVDYVRDWFAPCLFISPTGGVLLQVRTTPVLSHDLPERVPVYLTDLKPRNFGRLGKRIVQHDYANHLLFERGMSKRTKRATWDDGDQ
jgi:hypothetical protein